MPGPPKAGMNQKGGANPESPTSDPKRFGKDRWAKMLNTEVLLRT